MGGVKRFDGVENGCLVLVDGGSLPDSRRRYHAETRFRAGVEGRVAAVRWFVSDWVRRSHAISDRNTLCRVSSRSGPC